MNLAFFFFFYAFRKYSASQVVFGDKDDAELAQVIGTMGQNGSSGEFTIDPSYPLGVFHHMQERNNSVPPEVT